MPDHGACCGGMSMIEAFQSGNLVVVVSLSFNMSY